MFIDFPSLWPGTDNVAIITALSSQKRLHVNAIWG